MSKIRLDEKQKNQLLQAVRESILAELECRDYDAALTLTDPIFSEQYGIFVTLTIHSHLRGCIGFIEGVKPLSEAVQEMALQAAFHDPRFYPLSLKEFGEIEVEISILYPLEDVADPAQVEVGRHGLVMERGYHRGLLLPQVAVEQGWDRERFLNETCRKAGMEAFCWENGAKIQKFEAEVFGEKKVRH